MKTTLRIGFSILSLLLFLSCETSHTPTTPDNSSNWHYKVVDNGEVSLSPVSLCLDGAGHAYIAYSKYPQHFGPFIYLAHFNGEQWSFEEMAGNDAWQGMYTLVAGPSLRIDAMDVLHLAFFRSFTHFITEHELNYLTKEGEVWNSMQFDPDAGGVGNSLCLALDAQNHPHVSYSCTNRPAIRIADYDGSSWNISTVTNINALYRTSLAIDAQGNKHLIYSNSNTHALVYAKCVGSVWTLENISSCGGYCSIVLDSNGHPHISNDNNGMEYIEWDGSNWLKTKIDSSGRFSSIAIDSNDNPHISYDNSGLNYAYYNGQTWEITTLDSATAATSIALNNAGKPRIAYVVEDTENLKYAWYEE